MIMTLLKNKYNNFALGFSYILIASFKGAKSELGEGCGLFQGKSRLNHFTSRKFLLEYIIMR